MRIAQSPNDLLFNLSEIRPRHAVKKFRKSIIQDYPGDRCAYCGRTSSSWTIDHVIPVSRGGPKLKRWNMVRCCAECNGKKSNHYVLPWWRPQEMWDQTRENVLFSWMRYNSDMDAMITLEKSLREGTLDNEALEELKKPQENNFFDQYCELYPSAPECLIYDC